MRLNRRTWLVLLVTLAAGAVMLAMVGRTPRALAGQPASSPAAAAQTSPTVAFTVAKELISDEFTMPVYVTHAGDSSGRVFVVEKRGYVRIIVDGEVTEAPFLDIASIVGSRGNEQGLLSVAFHPRYSENGFFYVYYTDLNGDTVVARYQVSSEDPDLADPTTAEILFTLEQPYGNHNGGLIKFGPDAYLYIGLGDGGSAGDPQGAGQDTQNLLGKILRIDVNVDNGEPYAIPEDNPFADGREGAPEVWAYGLRNPWRFSFDRETGDLYIGDVGQNLVEEIDFAPVDAPAGLNFGWKTMEGSTCYSPSTNCNQDGLTLPVAEYRHNLGNSVTGGYVYRGTQYPLAQGYYIYGDFGSSRVWVMKQNAAGDFESTQMDMLNIGLSSFGEDEAGELYVTDYFSGGVYRLTMDNAEG